MPRSLQLLLVEDNPADAEMVLRQLRRDGYEPVWARVDTEAAFQAHLVAGLDLIISDYEMPQFSGLRALELLNQSGVGIPLIIVSGTIGEDTAVAAMKEGAVDYLLKDRMTRLGQAVSHAIEESRLRQDRAKTAAELRLFRTLVDQSADTFEVIDPVSGRFLDVNAKGPSDLGYTREEYLSLGVPDLDPTIATLGWPSVIAKIRADGLLNSEGIHRRKDGTEFAVEVSATLVQLDREYLVTVVRDITARRESAQKISDQLEELLRWQEVMLNREDRVEALKVEVNEQLARQGQPPRYVTPAGQ